MSEPCYSEGCDARGHPRTLTTYEWVVTAATPTDHDHCVVHPEFAKFVSRFFAENDEVLRRLAGL